jgi:tRNA 2-thiouridine synthesizing protein B
MLHTVNKSPFEKNSLQTCLRLARPGDDILLIEDAVYASTPGTGVSGLVESTMRDLSFYVLGPDLASRGIDEGGILKGIQVVDYAGFVDLSVKNDKIQSWL